MSDLFPTTQNEFNEPVIDSRIVADALGLDHTDWIRKVVKKHLEGFSVLKPEKELTGGRPEQYYWLTEEQALFAATLSRNNKHVVAFKMKLVQSFVKARLAIQQLVQQPMTSLDIMEMALKQMRQQEAAIALLGDRVEKVEEKMDKSDVANHVIYQNNLLLTERLKRLEESRNEDREDNQKLYR